MAPSSDNDNPRRFAAGEIVFEQGDDANGVYIVQEGEIELLLDNVLVGFEQAGGIIGEMAMIEESTRSATARARTDCVLEHLNRDQFIDMIEASPSFVLHLMRVMAERLRRTNELLGKARARQ